MLGAEKRSRGLAGVVRCRKLFEQEIDFSSPNLESNLPPFTELSHSQLPDCTAWDLSNSYNRCKAHILTYDTMSIPPNRHSFTAVGQQFVIDSEYEYIKDLGQGAYGCVIAARHRRSGEGCAIKKITNINSKVRSLIKPPSRHLMRHECCREF